MLSFLIYTYNRVTDARMSQELIRSVFDKDNAIRKTFIVHSYNGLDEFGYSQYLEDVLIKRTNLGHYKGAIDLINSGLETIKKDESIDYCIVLAADTWIVNSKKTLEIIDVMKEENKFIATSAWGSKEYNSIIRQGFAQDFFIIDVNWLRLSHFYPIDYQGYLDKFQDISFAIGQGSILPLELAISYYWQKYFSNIYQDYGFKMHLEDKIYRIKEREPIHINGERNMEYPEIGLYTYHEIEPKIKLIQKLKRDGLDIPDYEQLASFKSI